MNEENDSEPLRRLGPETFSRVFATIVFAELFIAAFVVLFGGMRPTTELVLCAGLTLTGAVMLIFPASRGAGVIALVVLTAFLNSGAYRWKLYGPLGFAEMSALAVGATMLVAPIQARWTLPLVAFIEASWIGSLGRQILYEHATGGYMTTDVNVCSSYFLPLTYGVLLCIAFGLGAIGKTFYWLHADRDARAPDDLGKSGRRIGRPGVLALVVVAGAALGFAAWSDWQIQTPCL